MWLPKTEQWVLDCDRMDAQRPGCGKGWVVDAPTFSGGLGMLFFAMGVLVGLVYLYLS